MNAGIRTWCGVLVCALSLVWISTAALGFTQDSSATGKKTSSNQSAHAARTPASRPATGSGSIRAVTGPAGEAGYVHYFVITGPEGVRETEVGIELADGRIVWSFPEAGVFVSPFLAWGSITIGARRYDVEHLFGLRPFHDDRAMRALQRTLAARTASFLEPWTPYCAERGEGERFCLSCLGFVLRVLFPGATRAYPSLPADFKGMRKGIYSTEDLLLYLARVPAQGSRIVRARRIQALDAPAPLREELSRIAATLQDTPSSLTRASTRQAAGARSRAPTRLPEPSTRVPGPS